MRRAIGFLKSEVNRKQNLLESYYSHHNICVELMIPELEKTIKEMEQAIMFLEEKADALEATGSSTEEADLKSLFEQMPPPQNKFGEWIQSIEKGDSLEISCNLSAVITGKKGGILSC